MEQQEYRNTDLAPNHRRWLLKNGHNPNRIQRLLHRWQREYDTSFILKCNRFQLVKLAAQRIEGKGFGMSGNLFGPVKERKEKVYVR